VIDRLRELDETCSQDTSPRAELAEILERYLADLEEGNAPDQQALLDAHPDLAGELRPYLESLRLLDGATRDLRAAKSIASEPDAIAPGGRQIGEYRIVREVGRGGMGIVYEAHQKSLNRKVALKVLPFAAVLDQRQIARFRNEAQAAAQLHHPHIVPVFAVGQEQGIYFYAMQYIDGQSLDQAITELRDYAPRSGGGSTKVAGATNGSTTTLHVPIASTFGEPRSTRNADFFRTAARLGKEASEALQHAHENGIIHRDVKPSNLLIDGHGKLWVTDFGLARIQCDHGVTLTGDIIGTLRYMSPEQASGSVVVDARTDVYSLGATLYELLTQQFAHAADDRRTLLRQIVDEEPIPPRKINPAIPVDLETIVLGAMAKARDDRYTTAQSLAEDLGRFLEGLPTLARRPTLVDRMGKWARRHRPLVAMAGCAAILLLVLSAVGMVLLAREQRRTLAALAEAKVNAQIAQENFERAERHFQQARAAVDQFGVQVSDRLAEFPGAEPVRRDVLLDTLKYYHQFALDAGDDPQLRREAALAHFRSGVIAAKLGAVDDAIREYKSAQWLLQDLIDADQHDVESQAQLALSHNNLGLLYAGRSDVQSARREYTEAIAAQQDLVSSRAGETSYGSQLAESQANLGLLLEQSGDGKGAEESLRAAVAELRKRAAGSVGQVKAQHDLAIACNNLSFVLRDRDAVAADQAAREAIAILESIAADGNPTADFADDLALCYNNLATLASKKDEWQEAIASHERAIALQETLARKSPAIVRYRSDLAISLNNVGVVYCRAGESEKADAVFGRARELFAQLTNDYPNELQYRGSLAAQLNNQALALAGMGRHAEALKIYPAAIEGQKVCFAGAPSSALMRELLSKMYYNFGQSLRAEARWADAEEVALERRKLWKGNGERLLGVAAELADLRTAARQSADSKDQIKLIDRAVLETLQQSYDCGWPREIDLGTEKQFASFKQNEQFVAKIAEFNQRSKPIEGTADAAASTLKSN
jgi:serine/threonine protein kinase